MLSDYREEKWWCIISNILEKSLICAYLTANIQDYILLAFEFLGVSVTAAIEDKRRVYENLKLILKVWTDIYQANIVGILKVFLERNALRWSKTISRYLAKCYYFVATRIWRWLSQFWFRCYPNCDLYWSKVKICKNCLWNWSPGFFGDFCKVSFGRLNDQKCLYLYSVSPRYTDNRIKISGTF